jgi:uncharacterized protein involved in tolerance to divalent cations
MNRKIFIAALIIFFYTACSTRENAYQPAENALDAAREFIQSCLQGNFKRASLYVWEDSVNEKYLQKLQIKYRGLSTQKKEEYKQASIIITQEETVNDSIHIIYYKNSYDKIARKVKAMKRNGAWKIDFKYTFDGNL